MFHFLEIDIREQRKYVKRIQTSVDDTVNDLRYQIKFENCVKDKNITFLVTETLLVFFKQKYLF